MVEKIIEIFSDNILVVTIISIFNKVSILKNRYKLQKNNELGRLVILDPPMLIDLEHDNGIEKNYKEEVQKYLERFIEKMEQNISSDNLMLMYNNLLSLKIEERDLYLIVLSKLIFPFSKQYIGGGYSIISNKLTTYSSKIFQKKSGDNADLTLKGIYSHELLHMSSSCKNKFKRCCGFEHIYAPFNLYTKSQIATGLNEGYTELLNERIFGAENKGGIYEFYKEVARLIEEVIGRNEMTDMYFNNDLKGLVSQLSIYTSINNTKKFILNLDFAIRNIKRIEEIFSYLIVLFDNKIKKEIEAGKITYEEAMVQYNKLKIDIEKLVMLTNEIKNNIFKKTDDFNVDIDLVINNNSLVRKRSRGNIKFITFYLISIILSIIIIIIYISYLYVL